MIQIEIHEQSCRGCQMCVDICPTEVFIFDAENGIARIKEKDDCIACLSCTYVCPSGAISHSDYPVVKNFYRDFDFCRKMEKFL